MRLNTSSRYGYFAYIYIILLLLIVFDFILLNIEGSYGIQDLYLTPIAILLLILTVYRGNPVFRYDSDGEVLIVETKEPFLGRLFGMQKLYEFPKRKLLGYSVSKWPLRRVLTLRVSSKEHKVKVMKVTISYLKKSELRDLERSLKVTLEKALEDKHQDHENGE